LGRVLTEARPMIPHGEFDGWCRQNAKMSKRTAEQYMQAYAEFGLDMKIAELGTSKVIKLLPMAPEEREKLLSENDVAAMSTRQLDAAIKEQREKLLAEARAEAQAEIDAANEAARVAERRAIEAENRPPEVPEEVTDKLRANDETIQRQQAEIERLADVGRVAIDEKQRIIQENKNLRRDLRERDEDMEAMQADLQRAQDELLNLQSAQARGEADRLPTDALTPDVFSMAVNTFIGTCCRLPQMGRTFSAMSAEDKEAYEQSLSALEKWAESARLALNSISYEEAIIIG
ncbi:MAG: DUF3102 domain-containing protein, partial [Oscillospiraceae bacterium]|nr:DUF3102 domain-containing protein [Oscillospiraceae bacterium]